MPLHDLHYSRKHIKFYRVHQNKKQNEAQFICYVRAFREKRFTQVYVQNQSNSKLASITRDPSPEPLQAPINWLKAGEIIIMDWPPNFFHWNKMQPTSHIRKMLNSHSLCPQYLHRITRFIDLTKFRCSSLDTLGSALQ